MFNCYLSCFGKSTIYTMLFFSFFFFFFLFPGTVAFSVRLQIQFKILLWCPFCYPLFFMLRWYIQKIAKNLSKAIIGQTMVVHIILADLCSDKTLLIQSNSYDSSQKVLKVSNYREKCISYQRPLQRKTGKWNWRLNYFIRHKKNPKSNNNIINNKSHIWRLVEF